MDEKKTHILVVEDEAIIALDISQTLKNFGFVVDELASDTDEAIYYIKKYNPDLVLMDIKLKGDKDGISIVETIQEKYDIPVIYLTSHTDMGTLKRAQKTKPYGYVTKPIDDQQLYSTILMALARREAEVVTEAYKGSIIHLKCGYEFDKDRNVLIYDGKDIFLTKKELSLISFLVKNINTTVSIEAILHNVWNDKPVSDATLRSLIRRVREKLGNEIIKNCSSLGYMIESRKR